MLAGAASEDNRVAFPLSVVFKVVLAPVELYIVLLERLPVLLSDVIPAGVALTAGSGRLGALLVWLTEPSVPSEGPPNGPADALSLAARLSTLINTKAFTRLRILRDFDGKERKIYKIFLGDEKTEM